MALEFPVATILLGYILGPLVEENFRRALLLSRGDLRIFVERPISAVFIGGCVLMVTLQIVFALTRSRGKRIDALEHASAPSVAPD
jgi:TctA family transporter